MGGFTIACVFPSVERLFEERVMIYRNLEEWRRLGLRRRGTTPDDPRPEPTLNDMRREYEPSPVNEEEEVTELAGLCLWDTFSNNHDVIVADGRVADIGSFRGAGAFLDEHLTRDQDAGEKAITYASISERSGSPDAPTQRRCTR